MTVRRFFLCLVLCIIAIPASATSPHIYWIDTAAVRVCTSDAEISVPPDFSSSACETQSFWTIDPQKTDIWIQAPVMLPENILTTEPQLSVIISGKTASTLYLNGIMIAQNGHPGPDRRAEEPGRMDFSTPVPNSVLRNGENILTARLSGHHALLTLRNPMHGLGLFETTNVTDTFLRGYWQSLLTFGAFASGALYFGVIAWRGRDRFGSALLSLISLFAAGQLFAEVSRGLFAYDYPVHDLRLLLIVVFSIGFGICLIAHTARTFLPKYLPWIVGVSTVIILITALFFPSFDGKAVFAVLLPTLFSALIAIIATVQRKPRAQLYFAVLLAFSIMIMLMPSRFLDVLFFYAVAGLLLFLFAEQAFKLTNEQAKLQLETERARQLEQALAQAVQRTEPEKIKIKNGTTIEHVPTNHILQFKGAGDYVALDLVDGRQILHSGRLQELEEILPSSFLRVHRSHIVNTAFVQSLERESGGIGRLIMTEGEPIPVSRRILPKVRTILQ